MTKANRARSSSTCARRAKVIAARYLIGIDLGTSHCALAWADLKAPQQGIQVLPIAQLIEAGSVAARPLLPSLRYHPLPDEFGPDDLTLPWQSGEDGQHWPMGIVGELARLRGARSNGRLVVSAKSWLCHAGVDRTEAILPWGALEGVEPLSPLDASASYLDHLRRAWDHQRPDTPLAQQDVVLTLPASFDQGARALTLEAARLAGLPAVHVLEEPQAACYHWLHHHATTELTGLKRLLVCDVGGGTTDFSLIEIDSTQSPPRLRRIGVGDHLVLGGDNMDLALARSLEGELGNGRRLRNRELAQLVQQCRLAKEALLDETPPEQHSVTLLGEGSRLVGVARSAHAQRETVQQLLLDGFMPHCTLHDRPSRSRAAIVEFGLPYAADAAITRHLAAFLSVHAGEDGGMLPDAVLLNGGVFRAPLLRQRLLDVLTAWRDGETPTLLSNDQPDLAVARGAVAYGLARRGRGLRIGGGSAHSYFLQLGKGGGRGAMQAVCLLPRGSEEGQPLVLPKRRFALRLGQPVQFHLHSGTHHEGPLVAGDVIELDDAQHHPLPPLATVLEVDSDDSRREVPVQLVSEITETGQLALRCEALEGPQQCWQLAFQLRGTVAGRDERPQRLPPNTNEALALLETLYGGRDQAVAGRKIKALRNDLERLLGKRDSWDGPLLRTLAATLLDHARRRRRSADHERLWFSLTGYCMRPGFGYPLDAWRLARLWELYSAGVQWQRETQVWAEWWILWRRVAGGLKPEAQRQMFEDLLQGLTPGSRTPKAVEDLVRLVATLEHLTIDDKTQLGEVLRQRLTQRGESVQTWAALGRIGARVPLYGSAHRVVPAETAARWLHDILALDWNAVETAPLAAVQLARCSGDRERDLDQLLRAQVCQRLEQQEAPERWRLMVSEPLALDEGEERSLLGDSLPPGLRLL